MSEVFIVLLLLVPILFVVFILNRSQKKQKKKEQDKILAYIQPIVKQAGLTPSFQKMLVHHYVVLDEPGRKLLVVNWKDFAFSHRLFCLDDIKSLSVQTIKESFTQDDKSKPEIFTALVGVEMVLQKSQEKLLLTFYTHLEHTALQETEFLTEATAFCEQIRKLKTVKPSIV